MTEELKRVLYVEDEPDIQKVAKLALETVGNLEVLICSSGAEAIEKAAPYEPDLLLLDVMMPGMDGPATLDAEPELINIPRGTTFLPMKASKIESLGRKLVQAMIAAAKADGRITHHECLRLKEWLIRQDCMDADREFIDFELRNPLDVDAVARSADSLEIAAEIYLASQFALEPGGVAEWFYLHRLAAQFEIERRRDTGLPSAEQYPR